MWIKELEHKRRTIADLIRFIGNTTDLDGSETIKTPNYSVLLGAGASVTSGVRSGQALVRDWKRQVFEEAEDKGDKSLDEYFQPGNAPSWYEENNSYSALFENRFDLQRHRRMFVEREVCKAKPSLGYAYLVKLIENGYFNTVFTTNFDDLLNEAFYHFSKNRPIVCAHDSSISGVTVTSTRPKIIKLHGDYLYENIKATLRETESLEANMKMKFQEFAKDFGLIVVGYSGQDRSIMDILNYLIQKEDYFKNGIFWCIRKGEENICSELKKLLWRDRVYFVEIDGFDELFAALNQRLNKGALPIDDSFLSRKHQENIIRDLTEKVLMDSRDKDSILVNDCMKLKYHFENNMLNDYLAYLKNRNQGESKKMESKNAKRKIKLKKLSADEKRELDDLMTEGFILHHENAVLQKLDKMNISSIEDSQFKLELIELKADLSRNIDDDSIRTLFDELIRLDPDNERYYDISANRTRNNAKAIRFLEMAVNRFPNDTYIINKLISRKLDYCEEDCTPEETKSELGSIKELLERSLTMKPQPDNEAYSYKYRYFRILYKNQPKDLENSTRELYDVLRETAQYHPQTLSFMRKINKKELNEAYFEAAIDYYKKADHIRKIEKCYLEYIGWLCDNKLFDKVLKLFDEYEGSYEGSSNYRFTKANVLMENEYLEDALAIFNELTEDEVIIKKKLTILTFLGKHEDAESLFESIEYKEALIPYYYSLKKEYEKEKVYYENLLKEKERLSVTEAVLYAYVMLQLGEYDGVIKLLKPYYDNPLLAECAIIVNYLFARKMKIEEIVSKIKNKILDNKYIEYSDQEKLGAYCVIQDKEKAYSYLVNVIGKEPIQKYSIKEWPVMAQFKDDLRFKNLLKPNLKNLKSLFLSI